MNYKKKSVIARVISVTLATMLLCGATFTGAYAANSASKAPTTSVDEKAGNNVSYPYRLELTKLPTDLGGWIEECNQSKGIFIIQYDARYFVYCNLIPKNYSWRPSEGKLELFDLNDELYGYALLSLPLYDELTVTYKQTSLSVTKETVQLVNVSSGSKITPVGFNASTVYEIEDGKIIIPFSIENIAEGTEGNSNEHYGYVCLGQIPNIDNAKRIIYAIDADSGTGLFVAMSIDDKSLSHQYDWYNFCVTPDRKIDKTLESIKGKIGSNGRYSGNYFLYVGTTKTEITNITGTITIEY